MALLRATVALTTLSTLAKESMPPPRVVSPDPRFAETVEFLIELIGPPSTRIPPPSAWPPGALASFLLTVDVAMRRPPEVMSSPPPVAVRIPPSTASAVFALQPRAPNQLGGAPRPLLLGD